MCETLVPRKVTLVEPLSLLLVALLLMIPLIQVMRAQVATADIVGTVTDTSDAVVVGAKMTATNLATGLVYSTVTNNRGDYSIPLLPAGRYRIQAEMAGFKSWNIPGIDLAIGDRFRADARLEVGAMEQAVQVTAESAALQTDTATVGDVVGEHQVQDLPVNGRNFVVLAQIVPGANNYTGGTFANGGLDDRRRSTTVSVNGRFGAENNFLIDGMDNNEKFIGSILVKPSIEALGEMRVLTNTFSAELGRTSGAAITFITKGGTNQFHGSAFEYFRNQSLDARPPNLAYTQPKPPYRQNNFGGSIGGPVKRNRTFFFWDWETYKVSQGSVQLATVPTLAMRQGDFSGVNHIYDINTTVPAAGTSSGYTRSPFPGDKIPLNLINPISLKLINMYPAPQNGALNNNYQRNGSRDQTDDTMDSRIDHRFSDKNNFFLRYSYDHINTQLPHVFPTSSDGFEPIGGTGGYTEQSIHGLALNETYTLSPRMVLVARGGYSRYANASLQQGFGQAEATKLGIPNVNLDEDSSGFPTVNITNFTGFGEGGFLPTYNFQNIYTTSGSLQYLRGTHIIKAGGDFTRRHVNEHQSSEPRVAYSFTTAFTADPNATTTTGNAMASLLVGYPGTTTRNRYLIHPGYRYVETGWYLQDDWRTSRWLTLNLGGRWDYYSPLSEEYGRIANFNFTTLKLMFPGQNGVGNTVGVQKEWHNVSPRFGFAAQANQKTVVRGGLGVNYTPLLQGTPGSFRNPPFISTLTITPTNITPINSISDPIPPLTPIDPVNLSGPIAAVAQDYKLPYVLQYNLTVQRQLPLGLVLTTGYAASLGRDQSGSNLNVDRNGAPPGAANVQLRRVYSAVYPNMTTINTVMNYFTSSYHSLQTTLGFRYRYGMTLNVNHTWAHTIDNPEVRYLAFALPATIKGNANSDIRQRVSIAWNWDLPFGRNSKKFYALFIREWRLNALGFAQTGSPFSIAQTGTQTNNATGSNRPNQVGSILVPDNAPAGQWFNPAAFAAQPNFTWGNLGRNTLAAPGMWNFDLGLSRELRPVERITLQFRIESFDFTNTVTPAQPVSTLGQADFGKIITFTGNRQSQVALKILF